MGRKKINCQEGMFDASSATKNEIELDKLHMNDEEECQYLSPQLTKKQLKRLAK